MPDQLYLQDHSFEGQWPSSSGHLVKPHKVAWIHGYQSDYCYLRSIDVELPWRRDLESGSEESPSKLLLDAEEHNTAKECVIFRNMLQSDLNSFTFENTKYYFLKMIPILVCFKSKYTLS